jgi:hypothetical protein
MAASFDREQLLAALDEVGRAAIEARSRLDIAVYGGSALMLASNFRFGTEDVGIADLGHAWPGWLTDVVLRIATRNGWSDQWLNDGVTFHLSALAVPARDLVSFGTFPRGSGNERTGVTVFVPTARYMLALKLKALRVSDFAMGSKDIDDLRNLLSVLNITEIEPAIEVLSEFFPRSGADADKQRFVLKSILSKGAIGNAPRYPRGSDREDH